MFVKELIKNGEIAIPYILGLLMGGGSVWLCMAFGHTKSYMEGFKDGSTSLAKRLSKTKTD